MIWTPKVGQPTGGVFIMRWIKEEKLKKKAIRDSIKASNAIENIHTTEKRIDDIASGDNFVYTHPEKEIVGYRNVLNNIHTFNETIIFNETSILALRKQLLDVAEVGGRAENVIVNGILLKK